GLLLTRRILLDGSIYPLPGHRCQPENDLLGKAIAQLLTELFLFPLLGEYIGLVVTVGFAGSQIGCCNEWNPIRCKQFNGYRVAKNILSGRCLCGNGRGPPVLLITSEPEQIIRIFGVSEFYSA